MAFIPLNTSHTLLPVILNTQSVHVFIVKFHWHCPLPHGKVQILGMPFKSIYCIFPSYCYEYSVLRHYFPKHLISFLSHAFLCLFLSLCLKCFFNFSSLSLFIFFLQAQLKCQILSKVVKPSSAGEIKCYLILLLFGLGCIHPSSNLQQTLKINLVSLPPMVLESLSGHCGCACSVIQSRPTLLRPHGL